MEIQRTEYFEIVAVDLYLNRLDCLDIVVLLEDPVELELVVMA